MWQGNNEICVAATLSYSFMNQHSCVKVNGTTELKEKTKIYLNFSTATVYSANPTLSWVTIILEAPISASPLVRCWRSRNSLEFLNWPLDSTTCNLYGFYFSRGISLWQAAWSEQCQMYSFIFYILNNMCVMNSSEFGTLMVL